MPPMMGGPPPDDGRGKKRKKRRRGLLGTIVEAVIIGLLLSALIRGFPLIFGADPWDAQYFADASGYDLQSTLAAKWDALRMCFRHTGAISSVKFSHDGKSVTLYDRNGALLQATAEGYDYDESAEAASDWDEALRILREWGLD